MSTRCPDCGKFTSMETLDPEIQSVSCEPGEAGFSVRIVRACADCGTEMKETELELEFSFDYDEAHEHHEMEVLNEQAELIEESGSRYEKSYYGARVSGDVICDCGEKVATIEVSDKVAASDMEDLC